MEKRRRHFVVFYGGNNKICGDVAKSHCITSDFGCSNLCHLSRIRNFPFFFFLIWVCSFALHYLPVTQLPHRQALINNRRLIFKKSNAIKIEWWRVPLTRYTVSTLVGNNGGDLNADAKINSCDRVGCIDVDVSNRVFFGFRSFQCTESPLLYAVTLLTFFTFTRFLNVTVCCSNG